MPRIDKALRSAEIFESKHPDWRWRVGARLAECGPEPSRRYKQAYAALAAQWRHAQAMPDPHARPVRVPESLKTAWHVQMQSTKLRRYLEAQTLAGASVDHIAGVTGLEAQTIGW